MEHIADTRLLDKLSEILLQTIYTPDEKFLKNLKNFVEDDRDIRKYRYWEWTYGVGLYGFYNLYKATGDEKYLDVLDQYYQERISEGLPFKNVNTCAPMLTMALLYSHRPNPSYCHAIQEWADWVMNEMPRTREGGLQHITSDCINPQQLWDDTLMMTVLFLQQAGLVLKRKDYVDEAAYQFLLHTKYLADKKTGLWYHGWTFEGNHNFVNALWGRGNSWITISFPDFLEALEGHDDVREFLQQTLVRQAEALKECQDENGMWHTLLDDKNSYPEASATAGFAAGLLKSVRLGYLEESYREVAQRAVKALQSYIGPDGMVSGVSLGTAMGHESLDFYRGIGTGITPYGQSMMLLALVEYDLYAAHG